MAICQFFLRGNCKFGSRCRNEHDKPNERQYNDGYNQYENQNRQQRHNNYDRYEDTQRYHNNQGKKQNNRKWNRYEALENQSQDIEIQSEDDKMIATIQEDIKGWANQKMWPYSCYSPTAEKPCLEGLPDISPEELRVLFCFHDFGVYQNILNEMNTLYMRKKEEYFEMSDMLRASVLNYLSTEVNTNPSCCISIHEMYGKNAGPQLAPTSLNGSKQIDQTLPPISEMAESDMTKSPPNQTSTVPLTAATFIPKSKHSIFADNKERTLLESSKTVDVTYTEMSLLTDSEIEQFQMPKFALGKIPTRPPPKEFCNQNNFQ